MESHILDNISISVETWQKIAPLFAATMIFLYALYICVVTESLFIIKNRILDLLGTKHNFAHEKLKKHQQQELDLHHFNFKFQLNVKTPYAMDKLLNWSERHGIRLNEIKKARPHFNPTNQSFKIPKPRFVKTFATATTVLAALIFLAIHTPNAALIKVNQTGQWFWVSQNKASSFTSFLPEPLQAADAWKINAGDCLLNQTTAPLSDAWDKKVICYLLLDNEKGYAERTVREQKILAWVLSLPWLLVPISVFQGIRRRRHAEALQRRSQKKLQFEGSPLPEYARYYHD